MAIFLFIVGLGLAVNGLSVANNVLQQLYTLQSIGFGLVVMCLACILDCVAEKTK